MNETKVYIVGKEYCEERFDPEYIKVIRVFLEEDLAKEFVRGESRSEYKIVEVSVTTNRNDFIRDRALKKLSNEEKTALGLL